MFHHSYRLLVVAALVLLLVSCQFGSRDATPTTEPVDGQTGTATAITAATVAPSPTYPPTYTPTTPPTGTPMRRATSTPIPAATHTPVPSPSPTPVQPDAGPLPALWRELDWGLGTGEAHSPSSLAVDPSSGLAYVLSQCGAESSYESHTPSTCLSAFDLEANRVVWQGTLPAGYEGDLLLAGDTLYVHRRWAGDLYAFSLPLFTEEGQFGEPIRATETMSDVLAIAFDGQETTYALTETGVARLSPNPTTVPLEEGDETARTDSPVGMAATGERIYLLGYETLKIFDRRLSLVKTIDLQEEHPRALALDAEHGRLCIGAGTGLYVLDTATDVLMQAEATVESIEALRFDASGRHLYAMTRRLDWFGGTEVLDIEVLPGLGRASWPVSKLFSTLSGYMPDMAVDEAHSRLLIVSHDDHALIPVDLDSGRVDPRLPLGIAVSEVIVDQPEQLAEEGRLYVSDSSGWIHVLDRQTYKEIGRIYGGQHISLDLENNRLYAGDPRLPVVTVFDATSLRRERTIRQPGKPRADPSTGRVVIVNRRFYVYDGANGALRGELLAGIGRPPLECTGCFYTIASDVTIDAQRGLTTTTTYTPWPGKPGPRESTDYDPVSGRAYYSLLTGGYVHHSSIATYADLGQLQRRSQPVLSLEGLSGYLNLDPSVRRLYVTRANVLFVLDSETLNRVGRVEVDGWEPIITAVDGALGRLYTPHGNKLVIWTRSGGAPPAPLAAEPVTVAKADGDRAGDTVDAILPSPNFSQDGTLLATIDGKLCRSTDGGDSWERLRGGLPEFGAYGCSVYGMFSPDYAKDSTLFAGIALGDTHGEGVYCSRDDGETWQSCSDGLRALRVKRIVASPHYAQDHTLLAYSDTPQGEALYRSTNAGKDWQLVLQQTSFGTPPLPRLAELFYATEHLPHFECDFEGACQRSDDGGATWTPFDTGQIKLEWLIEYALSPHFAEDGTVYFLTQSDLVRYQEGEDEWAICTLPIFGERDYTNYFTSLAVAASGQEEETTDATLFIGSRAGEFHRFSPDELPWEIVVPPATPPPPTPTPTPCAGTVDERFQIETARLPSRLGCVTGTASQTPSAAQLFERGTMFWLEEGRRIFVLSQEGTWAAFEDTWTEEQPDRDPNLVPPEGLYQPMRGFGKVWRESLGGGKAPIGWATAPESPSEALVQPFASGLLLQGEAQSVYVLYDNGTWASILKP